MSYTVKFLNDFITWRAAKILKANPAISSINPATLTVPDFLKFSTYDPVTKKEIVKERADIYFVQCLNYFQTDAGLKASGIARPTLSAELLELVQDPIVASFFKKYAPLSLAQTIYESFESHQYKGDIRGTAIENELLDINDNTFLPLVSMKLYLIALIELVPGILPFVYHVGTFNTKVRAVLGDISYIYDWVKQAVPIHIANIDNDSIEGCDSFRFNELKAKLDLLQPGSYLSNDILSTYIYTILAYYSSTMMDPFYSVPIVKGIIEKTLNRMIKNQQNEYLPLIEDMRTKLITDGLVSTLASKLSEIVIAASISPGIPLSLDSLTTANTAYPMKFILETASEFAAYKTNALFQKFLNGLYMICQVNVISHSLVNYENLDVFDITLLYIGESTFITRYVDGKAKYIYFIMGDFIKALTRTQQFRDPVDLSNAFINLIPRCYNNETMKLVSKLLPSIFTLAKDYQGYVNFSAAKDKQNLEDLPLSLERINPTFVRQISTFAAQETSYSNPSLLYLQGHIFNQSIQRKYLKKLIIQTLSTIPVPPPIDFTVPIVIPNFDFPDPINDFINSLEKKYQLTYDGDDDVYGTSMEMGETLCSLAEEEILECWELIIGN